MSFSPRPLLGLLAAAALAFSSCSAEGDETISTPAPSVTTEVDAPTTTTGGDTSTTEEDAPTTTTTETGGGGGGGDRDEFVAAASESFAKGVASDDAEMASCVIESWVDVVGFDQLADVSADDFANGYPEAWGSLDLDDGQVDELFVGMESCDFDMVASLQDSWAAEESPETAACIRGVLTDDLVREYLEATFSGEDRSDDLWDALDDCNA